VTKRIALVFAGDADSVARGSFADGVQKGANGGARIRLHAGFASVAGRKCLNSLYNAQLSGGAVDVDALVRATGQRLARNKSLRKGPQCPS